MCSIVDRAAGEQDWLVREKANDKTENKEKSNKDAGRRTPGGFATRDPEASYDGTSP